ncbi:hypothetical protein COLO4_25580 [Corchorus olitorius]|uniref:Uncharacterized protein n=1 Tax=Corchorus olitorius TaxID=93759 RepID=A0A1R3I1C1_9ROSI|nr:hypothetical protein COLO4_25580 [Corchorus olitorius]
MSFSTVNAVKHRTAKKMHIFRIEECGSVMTAR